MATEKKICAEKWALYDGGPDHAKRWFLYTTTSRQRDYAGLGKIKDLQARRARAEQILKERNDSPVPESPAVQENALSALAMAFIEAAQTTNDVTLTGRKMGAKAWEREMAAAGLNYSTVTPAFAKEFMHRFNGYTYHAKTLMKMAVKRRLIDENPFEGLRVGKFMRPHLPAARIPTTHIAPAWNRLKERDTKVYMMSRILYYCFIRPREQCRLTVEDVNIAERYILIPAAKSKNGKAQAVKIPTQLAAELTTWIQGKKYLFQKGNGQPYRTPQTFRVIHQDALKDMKGIPERVKLYSWKHTGVIAALKAKVPPKQLQMQLRHSTLKQMEIYSSQMNLGDMEDVEKGW